MIKQTQAQIEAAAKALADLGFEPKYHNYEAIAKAALTAAAQVAVSGSGPIGPFSETAKRLYGEIEWLKAENIETRKSTIERCVKRINEYSDLTLTQKQNIAAAIRKLKDQ